MEYVILLFIFLVEICFTIYRINTRSNQQKIAILIRIITLLFFFLLIMISFIQWSFHWYAFAAWLLILVIIAAISQVIRRESSEKFKKRSVISKTIALLGIFLLTIAPALIFPQHDPLQVTGNYLVATKVYKYTDLNRVETYSPGDAYRNLTVQYWYPQNADAFYPLVVFSHGAFGVRASNISLYMELASHGYVVAAIDHTFHSLFSTDTDGKTTLISSSYMREISREDAHSDKSQSFAYYQKWMNIRTGDINFLIDHILEQENLNESDEVYRLVSKDRIGVMGHSLGGTAALGIGRQRQDVSAVMALESPYLSDIIAVAEGQFVWNEHEYTLPVLNIYSDSSWEYLAQWPQYAKNAEMLTDGSAGIYNVHIKGAGHLTLTDLALTSPILTRMLNGHQTSIGARQCLTIINEITLDFFNFYLKGHDMLYLKHYQDLP